MSLTYNKAILQVDSHFRGAGAVVDPYNCVLNQTNIEANENKFYILQLIEHSDNANVFTLFARYGRIGEVGKVFQTKYQDLTAAKDAFEKQFRSKTKNHWCNRGNFCKFEGKYLLVDYGLGLTDSSKSDMDKCNVDALEPRVQYLMSLIADIGIVNKTLQQLNINIGKMPLGNVSAKQISQARSTLRHISKAIAGDIQDTQMAAEKGNFIDERRGELLQLTSSKFYTLIPYSCGRKKPPIINSQKTVSQYWEMLDDLEGVITTIASIDEIKRNMDQNPYVTVYRCLGLGSTGLKPLEVNSTMWKVVENYMMYGPTHNLKCELIDVYELGHPDTKKKFESESESESNSNTMLLWHGTRMTNLCSILQQGLVLNPESFGIKINGKMFAQGIYLTNLFSKAFGYTNYENSGACGGLLLCEVNLGKQLKKTRADYNVTKEGLKNKGYQSVYGLGKYTIKDFKDVDGIKVPCGKIVPSDERSSLMYDEMVIYDASQINIRYLVLAKKVNYT